MEANNVSLDALVILAAGTVAENNENDDAETAIKKTVEVSETWIEENEPLSYRGHVFDVSKISAPIILSEIFQNTLPIVDIAFVGSLTKDDLAAAALATVWFNLWNSTMMGFLTAIDTLLAQSYGAQEYNAFSAWTGRSLVIVLVATFFVSGAIALCEPAMKLFGQDHVLAEQAGDFSYRLIPGLFPYYLFKVIVKYLQTQNNLAPGVWIGVLANGFNVLFNWLLIYVLDLGLQGAPWATSITRLVEFVLIGLYLLWNKQGSLQSTWPRFSKSDFTFAILRPFWKLSISGALSMTAEAWSFEITTILAPCRETNPPHWPVDRLAATRPWRRLPATRRP